jgi:HK97 family phage portal protein
MDRNYKSFAKEAYQLNVVGYQAIDRLARSAAAVKWTVWRGDTEIIAGPLNDLLARPNTMMTGPQYVQSLVGYWMLSGNRYQERVMVGSQPRELYVMRPDRMKIRPGQNGSVGQYVFELNGARHAWDADPITGDSDILHEKMFNPLDDWYGMSPIEAGAYAIDQHNETMRFAQSVMQNSARPSGALVTSDGEQLSDEQFNRLKQSLEDQYQGSRNAGRPMLLEGGLSWQSMGMSPHEIEMLEGRYAAARDICLSLGVPPLLLNIPGDSTYSNYSEARQAFWEDTVMPMCEQIAAGWTNWIGEMFGGLEVRPDFDHIPAIVEKHRAKWDMANASTDLTINERRALKGYEPIDGGDTILIGSGQINLEDAGISFDENGLGDGA